MSPPGFYNPRLAHRAARAARLKRLGLAPIPTSKAAARALAEAAAASHPITRIEPRSNDDQPRQQFGGRSFFRAKQRSQ